MQVFTKHQLFLFSWFMGKRCLFCLYPSGSLPLKSAFCSHLCTILLNANATISPHSTGPAWSVRALTTTSPWNSAPSQPLSCFSISNQLFSTSSVVCLIPCLQLGAPQGPILCVYFSVSTLSLLPSSVFRGTYLYSWCPPGCLTGTHVRSGNVPLPYKLFFCAVPYPVNHLAYLATCDRTLEAILSISFFLFPAPI